jgi:hypothetical protein
MEQQQDVPIYIQQLQRQQQQSWKQLDSPSRRSSKQQAEAGS